MTKEKTFKPMLACSDLPDFAKLKYPLLASPKLDGIRCVIRDNKALSRSLKPIPNRALRTLLERVEHEGLDGELMAGSNFQEVTSAIMSPDAPDTGIVYNVFDQFNADMPFYLRLERVKKVCEKLASEAWAGELVQLVQHVYVNNADELISYEQEMLAKGYEGIMLRDPYGSYKFGRSTMKEGWLLKVKRFTDAEATIVGFVEEQANNNEATTNELGRTHRSSSKEGKTGKGTLGAFEVEMVEEDGAREDYNTMKFNIGSGLTAAQRKEFWEKRDSLVGKLVKFKYQEHGSKDVPRSPIFLGLRDSSDL